MGRVAGILRRLWDGLPRRRWRVTVVVDAADEIPETLRSRRAVLVGTWDAPRWLAFDCPCGEGHRVMLNLDEQRRPAWQIDHQRDLTVSPSVDDIRGRARCHYFIRRGRIQWT